jgi:outer membrane lipoprotein-sorting protein
VDRTSLSDTPLDILLNRDVDLRHNPAVTGVEEQQGTLVVHARANTTRSQSNISLVFAYPAIELRQWMVKDNQGGTTTVALTGVQTGVTLADALFAVPVKDPARKAN